MSQRAVRKFSFIFEYREASWSAPVPWRFPLRELHTLRANLIKGQSISECPQARKTAEPPTVLAMLLGQT